MTEWKGTPVRPLQSKLAGIGCAGAAGACSPYAIRCVPRAFGIDSFLESFAACGRNRSGCRSGGATSLQGGNKSFR